MNAASAARFSNLSSASSRELYPGSVLIDGTPYDAVVVKTKFRLELPESEAGGLVEVKGIHVEISKTLLPAEPVNGMVVKDQADDQVYTVLEVSGREAIDADWILTCPKHSSKAP